MEQLQMNAGSFELTWNCPPQLPGSWGIPVGIRDICHAKDRMEMLRKEKEAISLLIIITTMTIRYLILTFIYT